MKNRRQKRRMLRRCKKTIICGLTVCISVGVISIFNRGDGCIANEVGREHLQVSQIVPVESYETPKVEIHTEKKVNDSLEGKPLFIRDIDEEESYLLAKIAMAEAEGEDMKGKALVMMVVLNRVHSSEFPNSIEEVIFQEKQFSPIEDGRWDRVEPNEDCWKALEMVRTENWDESNGALYFESSGCSAWHINNLEYMFQHGNHYFYK